MPLYALTNSNSETQIFRLEMDQALSDQLSSLFEKQLVAFEENTQLVSFSIDAHEFSDRETLFEIKDPSLREPFDNATKTLDSCGVLDVSAVPLSSICSLFFKDENGNFLFQYFDSKRKISNELLTLFSFSLKSNKFNRLDGGGFILDTSLVACLKNESLMFKKFHLAKRIFDLSEHFREATEDEVVEFGHAKIFAPLDTEKIKELAIPSLRTKIFEIKKSGVLQNADPEDIQAFARVTFGLSLTVDDEGLHIPTDRKDFKKLLNVLCDDVYVGKFRKGAFLSKGKRKV